MESIKAMIHIITSESEKEYTISGKYDALAECLFLEEENHTKMTIFLKEGTIVRKTEEAYITIPLDIKKETEAILELLKENQTMSLRIKTKIYEYQKRSLKLKYQILDTLETVEYQIKF